LPVFGDILYKAALSRSFRTMSALLRSGVPVLKAIEMAGEVASNSRIQSNFLLMRDSAAMGAPMNIVVKERKLFPPMIAHMIAVGEETGRTDEMLQKISDWYDNELSEKIKRLSSVLEPIMVVLVGIIVGFMVLAIFLPIISAIQQFM
jgi:type IV pilus assembly protein PilC